VRRLCALWEQLAELGVRAFLVAPALMGIDVCRTAADFGTGYVFAHDAFATTATRIDTFGMDFGLWCELQRRSGADAIIIPSALGSFGIAPADTAGVVRRCCDGNIGVAPTMVGHSGSMNARNFSAIRVLSGNNDFLFTSGTGIFDHPRGPRAGAAALRALAVEAGGGPPASPDQLAEAVAASPDWRPL
jgi:ribulose-bisphosphate carboxylase large chain